MLKRLLYINMFGITLLSLFNYIVFHNMNRKAYFENFTSYNRRVTSLAFQNIDTQIMNAASEIPQMFFSNIRQNEDLLTPQEAPVVGSASQVKRLVDQVAEIRRIYPYLANVDIYYEGTQTVFTGFSNVHELKYGENTEKYLPWYEKYKKAGRSDTFLAAPEVIYPTGEPVVTYVKRITQPKWGDKGILVAIHISLDGFKRFIDEAAGSLVILSHTGSLLYESAGSDPQITEAILRNMLRDKEFDGDEITQARVPVNGVDYTVFSSDFLNTNLEYVYYVQNSTFYADYNIRNQIFLFNFLISVIYNVVILAAFSLFNHHIYKREVEKAAIDAGIDVKSSQSFDNSLNVLTQEINTMQPMVLQNELRALILNRPIIGGYDRLNAYLAGYEQVCAVILYVTNGESFRSTAVEMQQEFTDGTFACGGLSIAMERGEMACICLTHRENFREGFADFIRRIRKMEPNCYIVTGNVCTLTLESLRESYLNASEVGRYRFIFHDRHLLTWEDVDISHRKSSGSHVKLFENMKKDINSENFLDFKYHMRAFRVSFEEGHYSIDYCLSTLRDLVSLVCQITSQRQLDMWVIFGYDIREYYKEIESIEEFEAWIVDLCEIILQNLRQRRRIVNSDFRERLMELIDENLENDISLDFLSDRLSMNPSVLSRLFKQAMGKGYAEYIKEKKLARALDLMTQDLSMSEIAHRLGYNSAQYFIKVFKEVYGETPYQYKKHMLASEKK